MIYLNILFALAYLSLLVGIVYNIIDTISFKAYEWTFMFIFCLFMWLILGGVFLNLSGVFK